MSVASFVALAPAATNTVNLPSFTNGDLALVFAFRDGNTTPPSTPAGWTSFIATGNYTCSFNVGFRVLQTGDTTTGVWTNATDIQVLVLHGNVPLAARYHNTWGGSSNQIANPNSSTSDYEALGDTWAVVFAGHRSATDVNAKGISGMTTRSGGVGTLGCHTKQDVTTLAAPSYDSTVNASSGWHTVTLTVAAAHAGDFPVIEGTTSSKTSSPSTSHTISLPSGIQAGESLIALVAAPLTDESLPYTNDSEWSDVGNNIWDNVAANKMGYTLFFKDDPAEGDETSLAVVTDQSVLAQHWSARVSGSPNFWSDIWANTNSFLAASSSATFDPINNPTFWDIEKAIWLAICFADRAFNDSYPTGFSDNHFRDSVTGAGLILASKEDEVATLQPSAYTLSSSGWWNTAIMAFRPFISSVPVNTVAPAVTGLEAENETLSVSTGTWTKAASVNDALDYTYQWQRDDAGGGSWSDIGSATSNTYVLVQADVGNRVRCVVTATDQYTYTDDADSNATGIIAAPTAYGSSSMALTASITSVGTATNFPPVNTEAPLITGLALVGELLACSRGVWTGDAHTLSYQWQVSADGVTNWQDVIGAQFPTFTPVGAHEGLYVRCGVTATSSAGAESA